MTKIYMNMQNANLLLTACLAIVSVADVMAQSKKQNVLFIICDDLRPELGCYGQKQIKSPNIDHWAAQSVLFNRAYCNIAVSGASRASLMSLTQLPYRNVLETPDI